GALTTTSDLKNNYGNVKVWVDGREVDTRSPKVGAFVGAHTKTGIGSLLPTGASVGTASNLFGGRGVRPQPPPAVPWGGRGRRADERTRPRALRRHRAHRGLASRPHAGRQGGGGPARALRRHGEGSGGTVTRSSAGRAAVLAVGLTVAYTQLPLYSANQNTY